MTTGSCTDAVVVGLCVGRGRDKLALRRGSGFAPAPFALPRAQNDPTLLHRRPEEKLVLQQSFWYQLSEGMGRERRTQESQGLGGPLGGGFRLVQDIITPRTPPTPSQGSPGTPRTGVTLLALTFYLFYRLCTSSQRSGTS